MSDTVVNNSANGVPADTSGFFLDGEAPRLGAAPVIAAPPGERMPMTQAPAPVLLTDMPTLPVVSPVLTSPKAGALPGAGAVANPDAGEGGAPTPEHPMAHLMPSKSMPSEAGRRAAEIRAVRKAKAKKIKIGMIAGFLLFTVVVGPPLGRWLVNAINESGNTTTVDDTAE